MNVCMEVEENWKQRSMNVFAHPIILHQNCKKNYKTRVCFQPLGTNIEILEILLPQNLRKDDNHLGSSARQAFSRPRKGGAQREESPARGCARGHLSGAARLTMGDGQRAWTHGEWT